MGTDNVTFESDVLPVVKGWANRTFAKDPDRDAKLTDSVSVAWELFQTAPANVKPTSIAWYAIKRVKSHRVYCESVRSITQPKPRPRKALRDAFDVSLVWRRGANPAKVAAFRIDFRQWFSGLNPRNQQIVELMMMGHTTAEIAETVGCSPGNVSQYRRRLANSWYSR